MSTKVSPDQKLARAFVANLKKLRKSVGFASIAALAEFIGQKPKTVECWISGSRSPLPETVKEVRNWLVKMADQQQKIVVAVEDFLTA